MSDNLPQWVHASPDVAAALAAGNPVVALESTLITHGLPRPVNIEIARQMEAQVGSAGAHPATVAVLEGKVRLGLSAEDLERLALAPDARKVNRRDLGIVTAHGGNGGTTVSATMYIAQAAGIRVLATGGIGGVHRGTTGDISADLPELARTPMAVVCSGAKSILDLPRTLEWLETEGVPVIGWQTDVFPAFFSITSGLPVTARVNDADQAAAILRSHWSLGQKGAVLICVPCPEDAAAPAAEVEAALDRALSEATQAGVSGKELTPFLLSRLVEHTGGASLRANLALLRQNARVAGEIARAWVRWTRILEA